MSPLRLCFVVESGTDVRLVEGLAQRCRLEILGRPIPGGQVISHPPAVPVPVHLGPTSRTRFAGFVTRRLLGRPACDAVLVQGYGPAALAVNLVSRLAGLPAAMLVCSPVEAYYQCRRRAAQPGKPYRPWEVWSLQIMASLNARIGRQYVALSRHLADVVKRRAGGKPIAIIPVYGVDTQLFRPAGESRQALRERLGLPSAGKLVFFSSRIAPEKDDDTLLEATRNLISEGRDVWLLNCSGGHEALRRNAERFGVAGRVIARDAVHPHKQLPDYYRAADLCVQASREEGLGFSPLEALACEVPVVAARIGGLRETILESQTGWTYPVGDAAALAGCIRTVMDDPAEARRRAAAGRQMVCTTFERERVLDDLMRLLASIAGRTHPTEGRP
jgi:glycosyltransferase involved in cell wall biosynthesis